MRVCASAEMLSTVKRVRIITTTAAPETGQQTQMNAEVIDLLSSSSESADDSDSSEAGEFEARDSEGGTSKRAVLEQVSKIRAYLADKEPQPAGG